MGVAKFGSSLLLAVCLMSQVQAAAIKVGLNYPFSGEYKQEGLMQKRGALLALEEINASGGVRGRVVELVERDTRSDAQRARENVDELADEGVAMLFGGSSSSVAIAASDQARRHDLLYFGTLTYSNDTTGKNAHRHMFRECYNAWMAAQVLGQYLKKTLPEKRYFYITADYTWGHTTEASMREFTGTTDTDRHGSVKVPFPGGRYREIEAAVDAATKSGADVVVMVLFGKQMVRGMRLAEKKGLSEKAQIVVPNLTLSMVEEAGPFIMSGVIGAVPWAWNVPYDFDYVRGKQFVEAFSGRYRTRPSSSAASAYSIVYQWKDAVERAGSFRSDSVRKALQNHRYQLLKDEQYWRGFDQQNVQTVYAVKVKDRNLVMKDDYRQNFFQIVHHLEGDKAAHTLTQWQTERSRHQRPLQLQ